MFKFFLLFLIAITTITNAQTTTSGTLCTGMATLSADNDISLEITIDEDDDVVEIILTGPADSNTWFGVGIGGSSMSGTYALIVNGTEDVLEYVLGMHIYDILFVFESLLCIVCCYYVMPKQYNIIINNRK